MDRSRGRARGEMEVDTTTEPPRPFKKSSDEVNSSDSGAGVVRRRRRDFFEIYKTKSDDITDVYGSAGHSVKLLANYYQIKHDNKGLICQYQIEFEPVIESRSLRFGVFNKFVREKFPNGCVFDGNVVYSATELEKDIVTNGQLESDDSPVVINIRLVNKLNSSNSSYLMILNNCFRRIFGLMKLKQMGRNHYLPERAKHISKYNMDLIPGYSTSISAFDKGVLLLNAEVVHKVLHRDTVFDIMKKTLREERGADFQRRLKQLLVGQVVLTKYNYKTYRIDDINFDLNVSAEFSINSRKRNAEGGDVSRMISYVDYYKEHYNIDIRDQKQPLLATIPTMKDKRMAATPCYLVPELCHPTGLTEQQRSDFNVMREMARVTGNKPGQRIDSLKDFIKNLKSNPDVQKELTKWKLAVDSNLFPVEGRVLTKETILFNGASQQTDQRVDWTNAFHTKKVLRGMTCEKWIVLYGERDGNCASSFLNEMKRQSQQLGFPLRSPKVIVERNLVASNIGRILNSNQAGKADLIFVLLPSRKKDLYDAVKNFCCVDIGVPSQCVLSKTVSNNRVMRNVCTKVLVQMNCKIGGVGWGLKNPIDQSVFVGIDTYHDKAARRSAAAIVMSYGPCFDNFYSKVVFQTTGQELTSSIKQVLFEGIRHIRKTFRSPPQRIIIYRDGVSDGQLEQLHTIELPKIVESLHQLSEDYKPKVIFSVVKKAIGTKLFAGGMNNVNNPPSGTVVDRGITREEWLDFYLVPQQANQGTINPTHINIIRDDCNIPIDRHQCLAYRLCHAYQNWTGAIRVPAPCQYAHKLAYLAGQSLHNQVHNNLQGKLYFL
ncbi:hypothetical protein SNEBB_002778 [Seison nebaliae]|nr:hypothetical protein SNEBB_002778 [Seison nebaliae]